MWFRYLTASAACAALLGLAATVIVRTHLPEVISVLTRKTYEAPPSPESIHTDGGVPSAVEPSPEGATPETPPTSLLSTKAAKGHPAAPARQASSHNPTRVTLTQELNRGLRRLTERRYEIKRRSLDLALGNLALLARWVRVKPEARDGKPFGFRLFAIRADGPFAKLGLRNDDILVSVNGLDTATPEHVLDAYSKLKEAPRLVLGLMRKGREIRQEYTIR